MQLTSISPLVLKLDPCLRGDVGAWGLALIINVDDPA